MRSWSVVLLLAWATGVAAERPDARLGDATRSWLDLQRGGEQASEHPSMIPGDVAQRAYQRYLESFQHPIPDQYPRAAFRREN